MTLFFAHCFLRVLLVLRAIFLLLLYFISYNSTMHSKIYQTDRNERLQHINNSAKKMKTKTKWIEVTKQRMKRIWKKNAESAKMDVGGRNERTRRWKKSKIENWMFWIYDCYWMMMVTVPSEKEYIHLIDAIFSSVSLVFSIRIASIFLCSFFVPTTLLKMMWKDKKQETEMDEFFINRLSVHGSIVWKWHVNLLQKRFFPPQSSCSVAMCVYAFYSISNWSK